MASPLLLLPLSLALAASGRGTLEQVDLSAQFPDAPDRSQGEVGSCHTFAAVAVVEAAMRRALGGPRAAAVRLSEADLFMERMIRRPDLYDEFVRSGGGGFQEGDVIADNVGWIFGNGAATTPTYAKFLTQYTHFRARERAAMEKESLAWRVDPLAPAAEETLRRWWADARQGAPAFRQLKDFLSGPAGQEESDAEAMKDRLVEQRRKVKKALDGFTSRRWTEGPDWPGTPEPAALEPDDCRARGVKQGLLLIEELRAGRPAAVGMRLQGLKAWGQAGSAEHANHAFVLAGFAKYPGQDAVFQTRNSWGGINPPVHEEELCRVYEIVTVLTPGETAARPR